MDPNAPTNDYLANPNMTFEIVAEPPNLMPPRSARLSLDTKHPKGEHQITRFHQAHPRGEPENPYFSIRITNEIIKLTSFLTISYITLHVHQGIIFINIIVE